MTFDLDSVLQERRIQSLYRRRRTVDGPQQPNLVVDGKERLAFCSNDYLGLANHPEVIRSFQKAANEYGVGGGASHLISGHSRAHHRLEEELAAFTGRPRVLLFSTGYMANLGVISALLGKGDAVFQDRLNHASLLDAGQLSGARFQRYLHCDPQSLVKKLERSEGRRKLVVSDGVFSMDGNIAPLKELAEVAHSHNAWLMVDDAHGFGSVGQGGRGVADLFDMGMGELPILMGTLGKGFGTSGAFVAGSEALIETLIQFARSYIYTTAMPPAVAEATRTSLRLLQTEDWRRERLQTLIQQFRSGCEQLGLELMDSHTPVQPIMVGSAEKALSLSESLEQQGILVTAIRPPTVPKGASRLRVTLSASHSEAHIDQLLIALENAVKEGQG
ncbi:8-amino-7-oxononanoate synthase [Sansalvadorimonas verongulae]|uniref:8-amino-7-oxononanoate synthase n=1 Tax=Sansalvadorimonas verongulae TaxID=2172824 RepID=UPI0012BCE0BD|nr:8-amino-7-oxononanoate synthase [Sansalvadorimonas verongulae]MTI14225.1 8-amino-7-oxononanoate synthase [Sansalvadorimonas verongulae]